MPTPRGKPGDLLAVPFEDGKVAAGLILHRSRDLVRGCLLVGFYDQAFDSVEALAAATLGGSFIATPQYLQPWSVRKGHWPVIGHRVDLLATVELPILRVAYDLYQGDRHVGRVPPADLCRYPELGVQGDGYVEAMLRTHFRGGEAGPGASAQHPEGDKCR